VTPESTRTPEERQYNTAHYSNRTKTYLKIGQGEYLMRGEAPRTRWHYLYSGDAVCGINLGNPARFTEIDLDGNTCFDPVECCPVCLVAVTVRLFLGEARKP